MKVTSETPKGTTVYDAGGYEYEFVCMVDSTVVVRMGTASEDDSDVARTQIVCLDQAWTSPQTARAAIEKARKE